MDDTAAVEATIITRAIGHQLQAARERAGLSQAQLVRLLPSDIHVKTLATYEQGVRHCTVVRLVEICRALGEDPTDLLGLALRHAELDARSELIRVDLDAVLTDRDPGRRLLRRWARSRLAIDSARLVWLPGSALVEIAASVGASVLELLHDLAAAHAVTGAISMEVRDDEAPGGVLSET